MTQRNYELRLTTHHQGDDNELVALDFELKRDGEDWQPYSPGLKTSSFLDFLHDAFLCQLAYLRMNAAERDVRLDRIHGHCAIGSEDFVLTRLHATFGLDIRAGEVTDDDLAYFAERCLACPVSRNLPHVTDKHTRVVVGALTPPASSP